MHITGMSSYIRTMPDDARCNVYRDGLRDASRMLKEYMEEKGISQGGGLVPYSSLNCMMPVSFTSSSRTQETSR